MWTIFKVFIELVTIASVACFFFPFLFFSYVLVFWPLGMWDRSSQPGIKPVPPALDGKVQPLDH